MSRQSPKPVLLHWIQPSKLWEPIRGAIILRVCFRSGKLAINDSRRVLVFSLFGDEADAQREEAKATSTERVKTGILPTIQTPRVLELPINLAECGFALVQDTSKQPVRCLSGCSELCADCSTVVSVYKRCASCVEPNFTGFRADLQRIR